MSWLKELLQNDPDPTETREWVESLKAVIDADGPGRAHQLLEGMVELTRRAGAHLPFAPTTEYINTIPSHLEPRMTGDQHMEWRIRWIIRWNAMAMVVRANRKPGDLGGHISPFASPAHMFAAGFNHFWHADSAERGGARRIVDEVAGGVGRLVEEGRDRELRAGCRDRRPGLGDGGVQYRVRHGTILYFNGC